MMSNLYHILINKEQQTVQLQQSDNNLNFETIFVSNTPGTVLISEKRHSCDQGSIILNLHAVISLKFRVIITD